MTLDLHVTLTYDMEVPTDILLQVEAAAIPEQRIESAHIQASPCDHFVRVAALDGIGDRIWLRTSGRLSIDYRARMTVLRDLADVATLPQMPLHQLPGETVQYLFDSHYCPATKFHSFVDTEFGDLSGGARIAAMQRWIAEHFTYQSGSSDATTTALDSFVTRHGVCRDYAHVMIVLARAARSRRASPASMRPTSRRRISMRWPRSSWPIRKGRAVPGTWSIPPAWRPPPTW